MTEREREDLKRRNVGARKRADADPAAVAATALSSDALAAALDTWPPVGVPPYMLAVLADPDAIPAVPADGGAAQRKAADAERHAAEAANTPAWRALLARDLIAQWRARAALAALRRTQPDLRIPDAADVPAALVATLATLPERADGETGLSLLTVLVEAIPMAVEAR